LLMTAKTGISRHLEQLQFLLNLGPVREGERVMINSVSWRVGTIHMFTQLTNPMIPGATLRIPLVSLEQMTSRPIALDESWFPCSKMSWILINGATLAQVTDITPEHVELSYNGGLKRWMPQSLFMVADVACLSAGFARAITFSIHASHHMSAVAEIPEQLKADVRVSLLKLMREEELRALTVELQESSSLSVSYFITAEFAGSQAAHYLSHPRVLLRAAMESSAAHGWSGALAE